MKLVTQGSPSYFYKSEQSKSAVDLSNENTVTRSFSKMPENSCSHPDIRKFDGFRSCLACGETVFEAVFPSLPVDAQTAGVPSIYEYTHLNYALGQEIRLMVLLPGLLEDPIRCEIVHVNLEDNPKYDAVSYTWATENGDASLSRRINISNGLYYLPITINCEAALRQLRRPGIRRILWIDAICIDQSRISERNHQVGLMNRIYSKATCVRICIQDNASPSSSIDYEDLFSHIKDNEPEESQISQLRHIFSLRYFQRAWVIQEVALARNAYLLVNSHSLLLSVTVLKNIRSTCTLYNIPIPGPLLWDPEFNQLAPTPQSNVFTCLYATRECKTTDERDRIYAILALVEPTARSLIPVDYSLNIESVYANVLIAIVATQQKLDVILHVMRHKPRNVAQVIEHIVKFVTAQTSYRDYQNVASRSTNINQFGGSQTGPWCPIINVNTAASLDNKDVSDLSNDKISTVTFERPSCISFRSIVPPFRVRAHYIDSIQSVKGTAKVRSWVMTPDSVVSGMYNPGSWFHWMLPFFRLFPLVPEQNDLAEGSDTESLRAFIEKWREYWTRTEWFSTQFSVGFALSNFRVKDEIFAIDGANAPWILRKNKKGVYQLVAECYLWAALELDVWNSGTKKGRWGEEDCRRDMGEQTRFIEIHGSVVRHDF